MVATATRPAGADEFREVLDSALRELDADEVSGPLLRAAKLSLRVELTDLGLVLRVAPGEGERHVRWSFADEGEPAKLELRMDSDTANAYLQGRESLAIAIARGKVRTTGESRTALLYLPVLRLMVDPYRRLVQERYPHLAIS
jgi:hypothetical protein